MVVGGARDRRWQRREGNTWEVVVGRQRVVGGGKGPPYLQAMH